MSSNILGNRYWLFCLFKFIPGQQPAQYYTQHQAKKSQDHGRALDERLRPQEFKGLLVVALLLDLDGDIGRLAPTFPFDPVDLVFQALRLLADQRHHIWIGIGRSKNLGQVLLKGLQPLFLVGQVQLVLVLVIRLGLDRTPGGHQIDERHRLGFFHQAIGADGPLVS